MSNVEAYGEKKPVADLSAVESPQQAGVLQPTNFAANGNVLEGGLQRGLKGRHLQMIAFGGVIGASIWYGTGTAIAANGPVGALVCFIIVGIDVYFVMQSLGEMATLFPVQGAFIELAGRCVDPALGFSMGWNYWYLWITNLANDYNATSLICSLWTDRVPLYGWILIFWAIYQCTSLLGVVVYGELEFYLASWKLICVAGGFLVAILINTSAIGDDYIGFRYWKDPGAVANGIQGWGKSLTLAAVYYCGTEMLAMTAAESRNPTRDLPRAIRQTFWRIVIIFLGLVFFAGIIVPSDNPDLLSATTKTGKSPWTIALVNAGWEGAGNLVNVVMLTAQFSSMNSAIYIASRTLVSLSNQGRAPRFFAVTTSNGTPARAIVLCNLLGLISLLNYTSTPAEVFNYLIDIAGAATFVAWAGVGVIHLRLRAAWKVQGYSTSDIPYRSLWFPYGAWFIVGINVFFVLISGYAVFVDGFHAVDFVVNYIVLVVFVLLFVVWKIVKKTKMVKLEEMDLVSGRKSFAVPGDSEIDKESDEENAAWYIKAKRFIFG